MSIKEDNSNDNDDRYDNSMVLKPSIIELFKDSLIIPLGAVRVKKIDISNYLKWLSLKYNGALKYLENNLECRKDPSYILEGVKSIIPVMLPYYGLISKALDLKKEYDFKVSYYSFLKDYHLIIKAQLYPIVESLSKMFRGNNFRVVVDSAPIFEKYNAFLTKSGYIGKNTLFIHKDYGSFIFLGEILTTVSVKDLVEKNNTINYENKINANEIDIDSDICKSECSSCIKSCPTSAITSFGIDVSRCLSYLTIEYAGQIDEKYWKHFKNSFFGCDRCQSSCPYNKKIIKKIDSINRETLYKNNIDSCLLSEDQRFYLKDPKKILFMDEKEFKKLFKDTSFLRAKYQGLTRNILIHLAVNKDKDLLDIVNSKEINPLVWSYVSVDSIVKAYKKEDG